MPRRSARCTSPGRSGAREHGADSKEIQSVAFLTTTEDHPEMNKSLVLATLLAAVALAACGKKEEAPAPAPAPAAAPAPACRGAHGCPPVLLPGCESGRQSVVAVEIPLDANVDITTLIDMFSGYDGVARSRGEHAG